MIEIFTTKFLTGDTILKPRTKVASGNKTEYKFSEITYHVLGY